MSETEFKPFPKIPRFNREVVVTEKIDGTNAGVEISDDGTQIRAASRTRWITPQVDNAGFARWVEENKAELLKLGPGTHWGEWFGSGIQRGYGLTTKHFFLFNTHRWNDDATRPKCCGVVPVLWRGDMDDMDLPVIMSDLILTGSDAVPGWMRPEGVVIFHTASGQLFKKSVEGDESPKGKL